MSAFERVEQLRLLRRLPEAEREARTALAAEPDDPALLAILASVLLDAREHRTGLAAAEAACAKAPWYEWGHRLRALHLSALSRHREAEAAAEVAATLMPENPDTAIAQSYVQLRSGRRTHALRSAQRAVSLDPDSSEAKHRLGRVHAMLGDRLAAESAYRDALHLDPEHAEALHGLVDLAMLSGRPGRGLADLAGAAKLDAPSIPRLLPKVREHLRVVGPRLSTTLTLGSFSATTFSPRPAAATTLLLLSAALGWGGRHVPRNLPSLLVAALRGSWSLAVAYVGLAVHLTLVVAILATGSLELSVLAGLGGLGIGTALWVLDGLRVDLRRRKE